jgi:nucleotide-binding universal stress UspA family protein
MWLLISAQFLFGNIVATACDVLSHSGHQYTKRILHHAIDRARVRQLKIHALAVYAGAKSISMDE